ncbi:MAG: 3-oxoacyl-[acyl-carrier-protein] reductase [Planctomycetes bacterium]|nr:3-oxoacyl-[acyl-carrier-protein] reductase [Planctomycetota bacterium]MBI3844646.1 3-oxoacyl-[acyl-carrier-protein] reductase [Planctomycetota bacterium]
MGILDGKTAIVTGASRGIGLECARLLAVEGANVALFATNAERGKAAESEIRAAGGRASFTVVDVADGAATTQAIETVAREFGRIDLLVNNAGMTRDGLVVRMSDEDFDRVVDVNLGGAFHCTRSVAKVMMRQKSGRIVNIASVVGLIGNPGQANYAASKGAIIALTKSVARELASRGILVNAIAPGFIDTDMTGAMSPEQRDAAKAGIPLGRFGTPRDVANAVLFLAGPQADYITGQVLVVDGGLAM